ncbi:MAG: hypothetical protein ACRBCK_11205 [Alphaproteobacteria bacterium]
MPTFRGIFSCGQNFDLFATQSLVKTTAENSYQDKAREENSEYFQNVFSQAKEQGLTPEVDFDRGHMQFLTGQQQGADDVVGLLSINGTFNRYSEDGTLQEDKQKNIRFNIGLRTSESSLSGEIHEFGVTPY